MMMSSEYLVPSKLLVFRLRGDLDMHSAGQLRDQVTDELTRKGARGLLLNLSQVPFMDSSGLGFILGRYRHLQEFGGQVLLAAPCPQVRRVLDLAGVNRIIPVFDSEETAQKAWEGVVADDNF